jgi:hypothetical protein
LEAGIKELIADLVPQAEWLARNAPTPPIYDILKNYLPTLPVRGKINGRVPAPPERILGTIRNWVLRRNILVHGSKRLNIDPDNLAELLIAVRDVLWLCDYYRGSEWTIDYLSSETREALGIQAAAG